MNKIEAIAKYATVYGAYLNTITVGGSKEVALAYAVQDMNNQTKHLDDKNAIAVIVDEAEYLAERMARVAA